MEPVASLLLVGCGHMGTSMLRRWLALGMASRIHVIKPSPLPEELLKSRGVTWSAALEDAALDFEPDVIVLAVRPLILDTVLPSYAKFQNCLFLSVIAGKSLKWLATTLDRSVTDKPAHSLIRTMPNVASAYGAGMTFCSSNSRVTFQQRQMAETLLGAIGDVAWIENEAEFDIGTALSGCGPAYVFALVEAMQNAGETLGLNKDLASRLARQTVIGGGVLLEKSPESAAVLRDSMGSAGTMTEAALKILLGSGRLNRLMLEAVTAAANHAKKY